MKRRRAPLGCLFAVLLFLAAAAAAGTYGYVRYMPTKERADLSRVYELKEGEVAVFLNYEEQGARGISEDGQTYLPVDWINTHLNERFYWDSKEHLLVYALPDEVVTVETDTLGSGGKRLFVEQDGTAYISLGLVLNYTDIRVNAFDETSPRRVYIQNTWDAVPAAEMKRAGAVRLRGGVKSPILTDLAEGAGVVVLQTMEKWSQVMTGDGYIGYVWNGKLTDLHEETPISTFEAPVYQNISLNEKIQMVWHQTTSQAANEALGKLLATSRGINVIAPTWFTMSDNDGNYESLASRAYVEEAHERGMQVWAVVDNFSRECSKNVQTEELLSRTSVRTKLIESLMEEADTYGFDGINLDFESLKEEAGVHYIQFIRELSVSCRKKGLVLSVDNYVPAAYNRFYNRREQGIVADYVIIMGYDEHYAGGEPGSVASLGYVKKGIEDTLELVPKEKVINGVPFYTRRWTKNGEELSSKAVGIFEAKRWVEENNVELVWDEELGQYYGELENESGISMLWMEDARSLELKMELIREYDLAGVSGWKLGLESADVWDIFGWPEE